MRKESITGILFILGAIGVFVPYTLLTIVFEYPDILRQDPGIILTKFQEGGPSLILLWWAFAILGLPLLVAYQELGELLARWGRPLRWLNTLGIIGLVVQMVGLLRWVFVVPVLAQTYVAGDPATQAAAKVGFQLVHQYGGVALGEHLGQLFTVGWTLGISGALSPVGRFPRWLSYLGYGSASIYLLAQTELFATVIPTVPVLDWAGLVGSTLWLVWLIALGVWLQRKVEMG